MSSLKHTGNEYSICILCILSNVENDRFFSVNIVKANRYCDYNYSKKVWVGVTPMRS